MIETNNVNSVSSKDQTQPSPLGSTFNGILQGRKFSSSITDTNKNDASVISSSALENLQAETSSEKISSIERKLVGSPKIIAVEKSAGVEIEDVKNSIFQFDQMSEDRLEDLVIFSKSQQELNQENFIYLTDANEIKPFNKLTSSDIIIDQVLHTTSPDGEVNLFFMDREQALRFKNASSGFNFKSYFIPLDKQDVLREKIRQFSVNFKSERKKETEKETILLDSKSDKHIFNPALTPNQENSFFYDASDGLENTSLLLISVNKMLARLEIIADEIKSLLEKAKQNKIKEKIKEEKMKVEEDIKNDLIKKDEVQKTIIYTTIKKIFIEPHPSKKGYF